MKVKLNTGIITIIIILMSILVTACKSYDAMNDRNTKDITTTPTETKV